MIRLACPESERQDDVPHELPGRLSTRRRLKRLPWVVVGSSALAIFLAGCNVPSEGAYCIGQGVTAYLQRRCEEEREEKRPRETPLETARRERREHRINIVLGSTFVAGGGYLVYLYLADEDENREINAVLGVGGIVFGGLLIEIGRGGLRKSRRAQLLIGPKGCALAYGF